MGVEFQTAFPGTPYQGKTSSSHRAKLRIASAIQVNRLSESRFVTAIINQLPLSATSIDSPRLAH
jgi:hypothetical protein